MLPVVWFVVAVVVAVLLAVWVTFTITRLDRLHARVDAAQAALDAQLVRRAVALEHAAESRRSSLTVAERDRLAPIARTALGVGGTDDPRRRAENAVGRAVAGLVAGPDVLHAAAAAELREAAARVLIARRFYNDAVRDTRTLRSARMPRLLHLAGHRGLPAFFDIDDTPPAGAATPANAATPAGAAPRAATPGDARAVTVTTAVPVVERDTA